MKAQKSSLLLNVSGSLQSTDSNNTHNSFSLIFFIARVCSYLGTTSPEHLTSIQLEKTVIQFLNQVCVNLKICVDHLWKDYSSVAEHLVQGPRFNPWEFCTRLEEKLWNSGEPRLVKCRQYAGWTNDLTEYKAPSSDPVFTGFEANKICQGMLRRK